MLRRRLESTVSWLQRSRFWVVWFSHASTDEADALSDTLLALSRLTYAR